MKKTIEELFEAHKQQLKEHITDKWREIVRGALDMLEIKDDSPEGENIIHIFAQAAADEADLVIKTHIKVSEVARSIAAKKILDNCTVVMH